MQRQEVTGLVVNKKINVKESDVKILVQWPFNYTKMELLK